MKIEVIFDRLRKQISVLNHSVESKQKECNDPEKFLHNFEWGRFEELYTHQYMLTEYTNLLNRLETLSSKEESTEEQIYITFDHFIEMLQTRLLTQPPVAYSTLRASNTAHELRTLAHQTMLSWLVVTKEFCKRSLVL